MNRSQRAVAHGALLVALTACNAESQLPQPDLSAGGASDLHVTLDLSPSCDNGLQDGTETAIDCGGGTCKACAAGRRCGKDDDCLDLLCVGGVCQTEPTCIDGRQDGKETDLDCGGPCPPCGPGQGCLVNTDCATRLCTAKQCATPHPLTLSFSSSSYLVMNQPRGLAVGDFNGDKVTDLCVGINGQSVVGVLAGRGNGTFDSVVPSMAVLRPTSVAAADLNQDGIDDVVVGDSGSPELGVILAKKGGLAHMVTYKMPANVQSVAAGDFTGDGLPDVAAGIGSAALLLVNLNGGALDSPAFFPCSGGADVALVPLSPGRTTDLVFADGRELHVCRANGTPGAAHCTVDNLTLLGERALTGTDFDGDGRFDVIVTGLSNSSQFTLFLGQANQALKNAATIVTDQLYGQGIAQADFNRDGWPDIALATDSSGNVEIFTGDGAGGFHAPPVLVPGPGRTAYGLAAADFNRDGLPDLAVTYSFANQVVVFLNTSR